MARQPVNLAPAESTGQKPASMAEVFDTPQSPAPTRKTATKDNREDEKPSKLTVELPAQLHATLKAEANLNRVKIREVIQAMAEAYLNDEEHQERINARASELADEKREARAQKRRHTQ